MSRKTRGNKGGEPRPGGGGGYLGGPKPGGYRPRGYQGGGHKGGYKGGGDRGGHQNSYRPGRSEGGGGYQGNRDDRGPSRGFQKKDGFYEPKPKFPKKKP